MKKMIISAALACVALAGCVKNEVTPDVKEGENVISFQAVVGKASSRSMIEGNMYETNAPTFGSYAFFLPNEKNWETNSTEAELYIPQSEVKPSGNTPKVWQTETKYYWPKQGSLTFFSFSPYAKLAGKTTCTRDKGLKITEWDVDANQEEDVMVADIIADQKQNNSNGDYEGVSTVFRHKLSQIIEFCVKTKEDYAHGHTATANNYVAGDKTFKLTGIYINNIKYKGDYTSGITTNYQPGNDEWTNNSETKSYTWFTGEEFFNNLEFKIDPSKKANEIQQDYLLILPQALENPDTDHDGKCTETEIKNVQHIRIKYDITTYNGSTTPSVEHVDYYISLYQIHMSADGDTNNAWKMNKKIKYTFTINLDENIIYWAPSVVEWESESHGIEI